MVEQIFSFLEKGDFLAVFVVVFIGALVNIGKIFSTYESLSRRRVSLLKEAASSKEIGDELRKNFKSELENEYFRLVYRVNIPPFLRSKMIDVQKSMAGKVAFVHFIRAHEYLVPEGDVLTIKLDWKAYVFHGYNLFSGVVALVYGISVLLLSLLAFYISPMEAQYSPLTLLLSVVFMFFGAALFLSGRPLISARKLRSAFRE